MKGMPRWCGSEKHTIDEDGSPPVPRLDPLKAIVWATRTQNVDMVVAGAPSGGERDGISSLVRQQRHPQ
jgi:hypothetical protein